MESSSATFLTSKRMMMVLRPPGRSLAFSSLTRTRAVDMTVATSSTRPSLVMQSSSRVVSKGCSSWVAQRTRTQRAACLGSSRQAALGQSARWILTPKPLVMKPTMASPGTGVQHLANLIMQDSMSSTITPLTA